MVCMMRLFAILQLVWSCCIATPAQKALGVNDQTLYAEDFNDLVTRLLVQWHTPGVAISVINDRSVFGRVWPQFSFPDNDSSAFLVPKEQANAALLTISLSLGVRL